MDRLKRFSNLHSSKIHSHLHSNMDRLKPDTETDTEARVLDLHSNMDRLKPDLASALGYNVAIYIPIWID